MTMLTTMMSATVATAMTTTMTTVATTTMARQVAAIHTELIRDGQFDACCSSEQ